MYVLASVCIYVCMHVYMQHVHMYAWTYACIYVHKYLCMCTCMYVCMCVYVRMTFTENIFVTPQKRYELCLINGTLTQPEKSTRAVASISVSGGVHKRPIGPEHI